MVMMEIQNKADAVKQAGRSVEQYASELQYLWGELDHYAPLHMRDPQDAQEVQKWVEDRRVTHFLRNLDPEFESRRAAFCHQDSLPTMEEAVSAMIIEESRQHMMSGNNPVKSAYTSVSERKCYNCGEEGHLSYNCPLPKSYGTVVEVELVEVVVVLMVIKEVVVVVAEVVQAHVVEAEVVLRLMWLPQRVALMSLLLP